MTRLEIRNLVIEATGRADKTSLINSAIDIAVAEVSSQAFWKDLAVEVDLAIAADEGSVDLPGDFIRALEVRLVIPGSPLLSRPLLIRPKTWLVKYFPNISAQSTGKPVYGYFEGSKLFVLPYSNDSYTIRATYSRLHPKLTSDTDEVLIRHASQAVVAYANFWVFNSIEKSEDAKRWLDTYGILIKSAKSVEDSDPAVVYRGDIRGEVPPAIAEYWLDPFIRNAP